MRTYIATNRKKVFTSGYAHCIAWALEIESDISTRIHAVRAEEKYARVVAEVTPDKVVHQIREGRLIKVRGLLKHG
ncbi:MAG: hypothetical protein JKY88_05325 [Pseudomonadales bacterium]|nr:hypothetical protein [Pseudomonadales bacterium]